MIRAFRTVMKWSIAFLMAIVLWAVIILAVTGMVKAFR